MAEDLPTTSDPIPYRIRVGVTGHRTIQEPERIIALVEHALDNEIDRLFDEDSRALLAAAGDTPRRLTVISPLAEGADRLVARAILNRTGSRLQAVLPLSVPDYLQDFRTEESKQEFRSMLDQCRRPYVLREGPLHEDARGQAYLDVGRWVVDHCDVLIAVWDGQRARGRGGTAEIVAYARSSERPVIHIWAEHEKRVLKVYKGKGLDATPIGGLQRFNAYRLSKEEEQDYIANLDRHHFQTSHAKDIAREARELVRARLFPYYLRASKMAKQNQSAYYRVGQYGYLLAATAVACVTVGSLVAGLSTAAFAIELAILALVGGMVHLAHRRRVAEQWVESRFLTERIRAGVHLAVCGVEAAPIEIPPYMGHAHRPDDWMVRVFAEVWDRLPRMPGCAAGNCQLLADYVREAWLEDQIRFHEKKADREGRRGSRLITTGKILFWIMVAGATTHLSLHWLPAVFAGLEAPLLFIALVFPAVSAALAGLRSHREHFRLEKQSQNMAARLRYLKGRFSGVSDPERFERLLRETEELMLRETQEWLMLMRFVALDPA